MARKNRLKAPTSTFEVFEGCVVDTAMEEIEAVFRSAGLHPDETLERSARAAMTADEQRRLLARAFTANVVWGDWTKVRALMWVLHQYTRALTDTLRRGELLAALERDGFVVDGARLVPAKLLAWPDELVAATTTSS